MCSSPSVRRSASTRPPTACRSRPGPGAAIVIVNGQPTAMDELADELLIGGISEILPELVRERPLPT